MRKAVVYDVNFIFLLKLFIMKVFFGCDKCVYKQIEDCKCSDFNFFLIHRGRHFI